MRLNIGCGEYYAKGWTNVDCTREDDGPQPDVVASADSLPFEDESAEKIYTGHFFEHISLDGIPAVLKEFDRVLKKDGQLLIVGPDLDRAISDFPDMVAPILNGEGRWEGDAHLWESRETTMVDILRENGWNAEPLPIASTDDTAWPITSKIGWQFAIEVTKR